MMKTKRKSTLVLTAITVFVTLALFLPAVSIAESPTVTKLDQIPPAWSQKIDASERFKLVLDDAAVLDKETGLVWEQSSSTTTATWFQARYDCYGKIVGGRGGWRLPTVEELMSLVDRTEVPTLPIGNPFDVGEDAHWSDTTVAVDTSKARAVDFSNGQMGSNIKITTFLVWCVRGGQGHDGF